MKIHVTIGNTDYEIEIDDLNARPIRAVVDGEIFEVWPEKTAETSAAPPPAQPAAPAAVPASPPPPAQNAPKAASSSKTVTAPIPGVIISVSVKEGQQVETGQELCILEAMKMNNAIRATRSGSISAIHIHPGDHVKHGQPLVDFAD